MTPMTPSLSIYMNSRPEKGFIYRLLCYCSCTATLLAGNLRFPSVAFPIEACCSSFLPVLSMNYEYISIYGAVPWLSFHFSHFLKWIMMSPLGQSVDPTFIMFQCPFIGYWGTATVIVRWKLIFLPVDLNLLNKLES